MANFILYLASCALLLALSWRTSMGIPVPPAPHTLSAGKCAQCSSLSKTLVQNIGELLNNEATLFSGFNCSERQVEVNNKTQTVLSCAPILTQNSSCSSQRKTSYSVSECLGNVMKDLQHYAAVIQSYQFHLRQQPYLRHDSRPYEALLNSTLVAIQNLTENCSLVVTNQKDSSEESYSKMWHPDHHFDSRMRMCKVMRGFHIRAITINRAMGYISSGDHQ